MKKTDNLDENRIWILYAWIVLGIFIGFAFLSFLSFRITMEKAYDDANNLAMTEIEADAEVIHNNLEEGRHLLEVVCRLTEQIMQEGLPISKVESLFVSETKRYSAEKELGFTDVYGIVNDRFIDGRGWVSDSHYDPRKRPWYKNAVRASNGDIQFTPYENLIEKSRSIAMSRVLADKKSVVAVNLPMEGVRRPYRKRWKNDRPWMLLNTEGEVIDHVDESLVGDNLLSNKYWGTEYEELARKSLHTSNEKVRGIQYGVNHIAYVVPIQNQWMLVKMYDKSDVAKNIRWSTTRNIVTIVLLFLMITFLIFIGFYQHRRVSRSNRIKGFVRVKMERDVHAVISGILGMNAVVMKSVRDENTRIFSEGVQASLRSLDSLAQDYQEIFADNASIRTESQEYSLMEVLAECYTAALTKAKVKNLQIIFDCDPDIPTSMWGNASHLRQIINNLLSDSVKRTETGSIVLSVGGTPERRIPTSTDDYFVLNFAIRDTGKGMSVKRGSQVEDWFEASTELCLSKLMLDSCDSELVVKNRFGEGTTFMFSLRQLVLNNEPIGDFESRYNKLALSNNRPTETLFAPSARILVVDDIDLNLKVVCGLLRESKVQIDTAASGFRCLDLVASRHYDLIFLDYAMPEMNGVETFERMKNMDESLNKTTPVIMVIAEAVEIKDSFLKLGFADYMVKPYFEKDLLRMLAWYLPKELILTQEDLIEFPHAQPKMEKPVVAEDASAEEELEFKTFLTPEEKLKVFSGVLYVQKGLEYFSRDVRCYFEVLQEFSREDKRHGFDKTFQMKDWNNYLILLHSVNSVANAIGADKLSEKTQIVEKACREYKFDAIEDLHRSFMKTYIETMDAIGKGVLDYEV